jgi:hypothetical protein
MFLTVEDEWLALRHASIAARGVLADLLYLIQRAKDGATVRADAVVLRLIGVTEDEFRGYVAELAACGVITATDGVVVSARLERDRKIRDILTANGRKGGRPKKQPEEVSGP